MTSIPSSAWVKDNKIDSIRIGRTPCFLREHLVRFVRAGGIEEDSAISKLKKVK